MYKRAPTISTICRDGETVQRDFIRLQEKTDFSVCNKQRSEHHKVRTAPVLNLEEAETTCAYLLDSDSRASAFEG